MLDEIKETTHATVKTIATILIIIVACSVVYAIIGAFKRLGIDIVDLLVPAVTNLCVIALLILALLILALGDLGNIKRLVDKLASRWGW